MESQQPANREGLRQRPRQWQAEMFRTVVEVSPNAMVMVDAEGRIEFANARTDQMFGYGPQELVGEPVEILVPARFRDAHPRYLRGYFQAPEQRAMGAGRDLFAQRRDGTEFPVEIGLNPLVNGGERFVLSVIIDITARKETEHRLQASAAELSRSNADLEQFAYAASHDLKEPLRMITGYLDLLTVEYGPSLPQEAHECIRHAVDGASRMRALIEGLLAYSRAGTRAPELGLVELGLVLHEATDNLASAIAESGGEIESGELPIVRADRIQMLQLFQNLIGNALKFRSAQPPRVRVNATSDGSTWRFEVSDNGIGIEEPFRERVFGMFQRLHGGNRYPGSGIGLALCRRIVERHGGQIHAESSPEGGTRIVFLLPR
jgi:PAS domain S-box-containing protein